MKDNTSIEFEFLDPFDADEWAEIPRKVLEDLYKDQLKLRALENSGVDSWSGWDLAMELYRDYLEEDGYDT